MFEGLRVGEVLGFGFRGDAVGGEADGDDGFDFLEAEDAAPGFLQVGPVDGADFCPQLAVVDSCWVEAERGGRPVFRVGGVHAEEEGNV